MVLWLASMVCPIIFSSSCLSLFLTICAMSHAHAVGKTPLIDFIFVFIEEERFIVESNFAAQLNKMPD